MTSMKCSYVGVWPSGQLTPGNQQVQQTVDWTRVRNCHAGFSYLLEKLTPFLALHSTLCEKKVRGGFDTKNWL